MKFIFTIFLFLPASVYAADVSGKWNVDSVRCLQGSAGHCPKLYSEISTLASKAPLQLCIESVFEDGSPNGSSCLAAYDNSRRTYNPLTDFIDKREVTVSADGAQFWSHLTKQSMGERVVYSYSLHRQGPHMAIYDYIFRYQFDRKAKVWKQTSKWRKEYFLSLR